MPRLQSNDRSTPTSSKSIAATVTIKPAKELIATERARQTPLTAKAAGSTARVRTDKARRPIRPMQ